MEPTIHAEQCTDPRTGGHTDRIGLVCSQRDRTEFQLCLPRLGVHPSGSSILHQRHTEYHDLHRHWNADHRDSSGSNITYAWTPNNGTLSNANVQSPTATPTSTTTYSVTATTPIGCSASGQVTITVGQLQSLTLSAANTTLCQGQSTQLNAVGVSSGDLSYAWTGDGLSNPAIPDPIVSPTQTTTYTCTVTQVATGCTLSQSITINMNTGYTADLGPDLSLCSTLGHQLTVQHNVPNPTYLWTPAANLNSATIASPTILSDVTATYTVTISDANGCSVSDQVVITRPFLGVPATQTASGCVNSAPTLTAPVSASSYLWNTGAVTASIVPTISSRGPWSRYLLVRCEQSIDQCGKPRQHLRLEHKRDNPRDHRH